MSERALPPGRRNAVFVDLDVLVENYRNLAACTGGREPLAVVKADAYGHGAVEVARALREAGAGWFGVATIDEGEALRATPAFADARILMMSDTLAYNAKRLVAGDFDATVWHLEQLEALAEAAGASGRRARIHVKVDSGMGRLGLHPAEALDFMAKAARTGGIEVAGLASHLARADEEEEGVVATREQLRTMEELVRALAEKKLLPPLVHVANSAGALNYPEAPGNLARLGIALYGASPAFSRDVSVRGGMTWVARVLQVKSVEAGAPIGYGGTYRRTSPGRVAVVATGYGDGYPRLLSNRADALLGGERAPLAGRVSMDMLALDVSHLGDVAAGDEAILLGGEGERAITCEELADRAETIPYEIMCGVGRRVPRIYVKEGRAL